MGQKDISEKILVDYNDVFADIINVCVYDGEEEVKPDDPREIQHVDAVLKLLSVMTGDRDYESLLYKCQREREVKNMCEVAQRLKREGREEGRQEGIHASINMLRKLGKNDEESLSLIIEEFKLDMEQAKSCL